MSLYGDKLSLVKNAGVDPFQLESGAGIDNLTITENFAPPGDTQGTAPILNEDGTPLRSENGTIIFAGT
jgi:hypothetical protein